MKKEFLLLIIIACLFCLNSCNADEWDDYSTIDRSWDGQKAVTNKEFEQVVDALQAKTKKKDAKQRKKKIKKISGGGTSLHDELNPDKTIPELQSLKPENDELLMNIPVDLIIDGKILEKGYYNVIGKKDEHKKVFINLYQSHYLIAKIEATETENDYGEEEVDFAKIKEYNEKFVKLIFGSVDFNAYAYIPYVHNEL